MPQDIDESGPIHCSPRIGKRYRFPWRDYEEFEVVALPYGGNVIELRSTDDPSTTATLCRNDLMNWLGAE